MIDWLIQKNLYCPRRPICFTTAAGTIKHTELNTDYWLSAVGFPFKITTFEFCELRTCFNHPQAVDFKRNCIKKKLVKNSLPDTAPSSDDLDKLHIHEHLTLLLFFLLSFWGRLSWNDTKSLMISRISRFFFVPLPSQIPETCKSVIDFQGN